MKKRKILAMLMVAALSAGMLAGCGSDNTKEESKSTEAADTKEKTEENKQEYINIFLFQYTQKLPIKRKLRGG